MNTRWWVALACVPLIGIAGVGILNLTVSAHDLFDVSPAEVVASVERIYRTPRKVPGIRTRASENLELTELFSAVRAALPALTAEQQNRIAALDPALALLVRHERELASAGLTINALPDEPGLTETLTGQRTIIHYTLAAGPDQAPNIEFVNLVQATMEDAIAVLGGKFRFPIPDGPEGEKRLHVYLKNLPASLGQMIGTPIGGGSKLARSFMRINSQFPAIAGSGWETKLRAICFHETMHGVHNAYNAFSSSWFREGQATWVEGHFLQDFASLAEFLALSNSVANQPALPLWDTTNFHHYSTALFMHYLVEERGPGVMKDWLKATATRDDALSALQKTLGSRLVFSNLYRKYLLRLFQRRFAGINSGIIPAVPEDPTIGQLGADVDGAVAPTGAIFRRVTPDPRIPNNYLFAEVEQAASGAPELLVIKDPTQKSGIKVVRPPEPKVIRGFKNAAETLLILTDTTVTGEGAGVTTINAQVLSPFIEFTDIQVDTPIAEGETSNIRITYNLFGTPPSPPIFPVDRKVIEKRSNVIDRATEEVFFFIGEQRTHNLVFQTFPGTPNGVYKFKFGGSVPARSFSRKKLPVSETSIRAEIEVLGGSRQARDADADVPPQITEP